MIEILNKILDENVDEITQFSSNRIANLKNANFEYVHRSTEKVKSIVLYNNDSESLAVRGVEFLHNGNKVNAPHSITFGSIKNNRGFDINNVAKYFLVCTKGSPDQNWIKIEFETPVHISKLNVFLRKNRECYRWANTFCLDVITENNSQVQVVNNYRQIEDFVNSIAKKYINQSNYREYFYCARLIIEMKCRYYNRFINSIDKDALELGFNKKEVVNFVNSCLVLNQKVQYTNAYGFTKTFSIWTDEEKNNYLKTSLQIITLLKHFTPHVCFAYGTALGFVREPSYFIPHDCDIDIICTVDSKQYQTADDFYKDLVPYLTEHGVKIEKKDHWHMHLRFNRHRVDVFPSFITDKGDIQIFPRSKERFLDYNMMYPTIDIDVMELECPIPKNVFKFLETFYGKNWRTPIDQIF